MSPSIRNIGIDEWEQQTKVQREELKQWIKEKFNVTVEPQDNETWVKLILLALQLWSGKAFSTYEEIITQYNDYEEYPISLNAGKQTLITLPKYDETDWGEYQNCPEWCQPFVVYKHWILEVEQGGLITDENDPVQMALQWEFVWLKWDSNDKLGGLK